MSGSARVWEGGWRGSRYVQSIGDVMSPRSVLCNRRMLIALPASLKGRRVFFLAPVLDSLPSLLLPAPDPSGRISMVGCRLAQLPDRTLAIHCRGVSVNGGTGVKLVTFRKVCIDGRKPSGRPGLVR